MDENQIVEALCGYLQQEGYEVRQRLHTTEHGIDVIAFHRPSGVTLFIEAKGGTSSRDGSARFGKAYTQSQVFDRVSKGVFTALELRAAHPDRNSSEVALAVPDSPFFRRYLTPIKSELHGAGLKVLFVSADHKVASL
jgi:hypothetical protein